VIAGKDVPFEKRQLMMGVSVLAFVNVSEFVWNRSHRFSSDTGLWPVRSVWHGPEARVTICRLVLIVHCHLRRRSGLKFLMILIVFHNADRAAHRVVVRAAQL